MRLAAVQGALALAVMAWPGNLSAQTFPERPIHLIVPSAPGGPTDVPARLLSQFLPDKLGQPAVVENRAGAGGAIGARFVAGATPDGYTLLVGNTSVFAVWPSVSPSAGYDPAKSFAPVAKLTESYQILVVPASSPLKTVREFVDFAKNNPGKLRYGAPPGIYTHFAGEFFKAKTGADILFVPYKGGAPAITDVLGGHIDMVFNNKSTLLTHFKEGKLKALAVTSDVRWPELPDTPTMKEFGVVGFPKEVWFGVLAPGGTPAMIVEEVNYAVNEGLKSPEVRASLAKLGMEARIGTAQDFAASLAEQARDWKHVVEATGIKVE